MDMELLRVGLFCLLVILVTAADEPDGYQLTLSKIEDEQSPLSQVLVPPSPPASEDSQSSAVRKKRTFGKWIGAGLGGGYGGGYGGGGCRGGCGGGGYNYYPAKVIEVTVVKGGHGGGGGWGNGGGYPGGGGCGYGGCGGGGGPVYTQYPSSGGGGYCSTCGGGGGGGSYSYSQSSASSGSGSWNYGKK